MIDALRYRVDFGLFMNDQSYYAVREANQNNNEIGTTSSYGGGCNW